MFTFVTYVLTTCFSGISLTVVEKKFKKHQIMSGLYTSKNFDIIRRLQRASQKLTRYAQTAQTSANPEDPDFGLWTPGSEA